MDWINQPPLFCCCECFDPRTVEAEELRVIDGKTWCSDCFPGEHSLEKWEAAPRFQPKNERLEAAEERVRELEGKLKTAVLWLEHGTPYPPDHTCGPMSCCDSGCETWGNFSKDLAALRGEGGNQG